LDGGGPNKFQEVAMIVGRHGRLPDPNPTLTQPAHLSANLVDT
jgi:hypothetical protein